MFSFVSASVPTHQLNEDFEFIVTCIDIGFCSTTSECVINIESPNNTKIITGENMSYQIYYYNYSINTNELGNYKFTGYCKDGSLTAPINFELDVTFSGKENNIWAYIVSVSIMILLLLGTIWLNRTYDRETRKALYKRLVLGFFEAKTKNRKTDFATMVLFLIGYGFLDMMFVVYYLDIMLLLFVFKDLAVSFGINALAGSLPSILVVWLWGLIVVASYWMMKLTTIVLDVISDIKDGMRMGFEG